MAHDADAEGSAEIVNSRRGDELNGGVFQDLRLACRHTNAGELLEEVGDLGGLVGVNGDQLAAPADDGRSDAVDVVVVQANHGEADGGGRKDGLKMGDFRLLHGRGGVERLGG